ncbi:hypothetical protein DSOUD_0468 [Desulfuromonas soudanensis]|jgi:hypothetical protein|uniref:Uncharacterized protein n=1 Tax=Desulfuromonas soudanensis TaxID=1603606 RepID=A0A0M4D419_9BACT|nr:WYL domain-containing protein [Desulfuromonas soudanensis]ALC15260.1 hypothetical protein DSOUD_0468 [Desulfuromonas soudanensis]
METLSVKREDLKWAARRRLELIEMELFWSGRVNRHTLMEKTGISKAQASADLAQYKKLAEDNFAYNLTEKTYQVSPTFSPLFISTSPQVFLTQLAFDGGNAEQLRLPARDIQPALLRVIAQAVQSATCVDITYQSMSSPKPNARVIAPHSFVSDGWRWHMRAFDFRTSSFRDFLLARILRTQEYAAPVNQEDHPWSKEKDAEWHTMVPLKIVPHPGLSPQQRAVVAGDFAMVNGEVVFSVRQACLFYVLRQLRFLDESKHPAEQQIVLANKEEVLSLLNGPEKLGGDLE